MYGAKSLKYLLLSPLQKNFANPCSRIWSFLLRRSLSKISKLDARIISLVLSRWCSLTCQNSKALQLLKTFSIPALLAIPQQPHSGKPLVVLSYTLASQLSVKDLKGMITWTQRPLCTLVSNNLVYRF